VIQTLLVSLALLQTAASPAPVAAKGTTLTPTQLVNKLFEDIARDHPGSQLWWRYLSKRTHMLKERVDALYPGGVPDGMDADWLCQCQDWKDLRVVRVSVANPQSARPIATVAFRNFSAVTTIKLVFVNEGGWKIDDIIDEKGNRYTDALQHDVATKRK
jgi:hypothetical protein